MTERGKEALKTIKQVAVIGGVPVIEQLTEEQTRHTFEGGMGLYISDARLSLHTEDGIEDLIPHVYERITCACGNFDLWVMYTASYETSAYCPECKRLWEVHTG